MNNEASQTQDVPFNWVRHRGGFRKRSRKKRHFIYYNMMSRFLQTCFLLGFLVKLLQAKKVIDRQEIQR